MRRMCVNIYKSSFVTIAVVCVGISVARCRGAAILRQGRPIGAGGTDGPGVGAGARRRLLGGFLPFSV